MKHRTLTALGLATLLLAGCASTPEKTQPAQPAPPPPSVATGPELEMGEVTTVTATVQAVDLENRLVTLKGDNTIFADGFANGGTSNWSATVP